jgi:hypothetical protein
MDDRDCPAGAVCATDGSGQPIGCQDPSTVECEYNSDCLAPLICAPDGRCREQCHTDRDCRDGDVCNRTTSPAVCGPPTDAGMPGDAGPTDAGPIDAAMDDASADAGTDTGVDASVDAAVAMTGPAPVPLLVAGSDHVCATRTSDGELRCWGNDMNGQIGDGTAGTNRTVATLVTPSLGTVTVLGAGALHACAYSTTLGLRCWGDGSSGQIGDNMIVSHSTPTAVMGSLAPTWIAAGHGHTCAVVSGTVQCWGDNTSGQLGTGDTSVHRTPTATVALAATALQVDARSNTTCALLSDGRIQCWGDGTGDQLGTDISPSLFSATPLLVPGIADAVDVAVGSAHACARSGSGVVSCWGRDSFGQLGDGTVGGMRATPAPTSTMPPAVEIGAAANQTCARTIDGDV